MWPDVLRVLEGMQETLSTVVAREVRSEHGRASLEHVVSLLTAPRLRLDSLPADLIAEGQLLDALNAEGAMLTGAPRSAAGNAGALPPLPALSILEAENRVRRERLVWLLATLAERDDVPVQAFRERARLALLTRLEQTAIPSRGLAPLLAPAAGMAAATTSLAP